MAVKKKRVYEIARDLGVPTKELMEALAGMGMSVRAVNWVEEEEAELIRELFGEYKARTAQAAAPPITKAERKGESRPPVVAVLGHIDHGKTTLLDTIRQAHVAEGEQGGITQSIGAYQVSVNGRLITFIDTPGHKAFTTMRARGGKASDIAILVVAADDGVMAQTLEAIDHIKAANVPMVVAINKIDKPGADIEKVKQELAQIGVVAEEWGGNVIMVPISALTGQGVNELLEMILLLTDMEDIRADPDGELSAVVIESHLDPGRGPVCTVIVKNGTLRERDIVVVGPSFGRIRALTDYQGRRVDKATPGMPVQILGLSDVPPAGEPVEKVATMEQAKVQVLERREEARRRRQTAVLPPTLEELLRVSQKKLLLVIKAASVGALDAVRLELGTIEMEGVELWVLHAGVGPITESDIILAASERNGQPLVVGFAVKVDPQAKKAAEERMVPVRTYDIIYDLTRDIQQSMRRLLGPKYVETEVGEAEVLQTFDVDGIGRVAGCVVRKGRVVRGGRVKVRRQDKEIFAGEIASLRRFTEDVREVQEGRECGIRIRDFDDVQVGDVFWIYTLEEVQA